jgi:aquaporin related protein
MNRFRKAPRSPNTTFRDDISAAVVEFLGTVVFLLIGLGGIQAAASANASSGQGGGGGGGAGSGNGSGSGTGTIARHAINTVASIEQLLYISVSMGLAFLIAVWMFHRITGAVFNPAVALTLWLCGVIGIVRLALYFVAHIVGAIAASAILLGLLPGTLNVTPSLAVGTNKAQGVFIEMFITAALCLSVLMLVFEKTAVLAPIQIGLTLFACHLWAVPFTGAAMNTARAFGPSVVTGFNTNHWIYWLGPFLGALLASAIYYLLKWLNYWDQSANAVSTIPYNSPDTLENRSMGAKPGVGSGLHNGRGGVNGATGVGANDAPGHGVAPQTGNAYV